jgi:L-threonylcarbamoyladenylate synthase
MPGIKTISLNNLDEAIAILRRGGVLVYPTETSYALGCDATNDEAVARVFAIKGRPEGKGTPLILPADVDIREYVKASEQVFRLADKYWPGPLNIVLPRAVNSPVSARCETQGTQSVRRSSHPIAATLAHLLGRPLVATSANRSGETALYRSSEVEREFASGEQPDAVIDAGDLPEVAASTTINVIDDSVEVIRQGSVVLPS